MEHIPAQRLSSKPEDESLQKLASSTSWLECRDGMCCRSLFSRATQQRLSQLAVLRVPINSRIENSRVWRSRGIFQRRAERYGKSLRRKLKRAFLKKL
jgi:hypothetical protein